MDTAKYREVDFDQVVGDQDPFAAWGYSRLKVQRGDEVIVVKVKIQSIGHDVLEELRKQAPKPPSKMASLDGEGVTRGVAGGRGKALVPDFTDAKFLEQMEEHNLRLTREVVGRGMATPLTLRSGEAAKTPEERYRALEERGLSGTHFAELAKDILRLTDWSEEERERFL